jgi:hypothetical protein
VPATNEDRVRTLIANRSHDLDEELLLQQMLGLMEIPAEPTEVWSARCDDKDCVACDTGCNPDGGVLVEAPSKWDDEAVLQKLRILGHTCEGGNQFTKVYGIVDIFTHLMLPEIRL